MTAGGERRRSRAHVPVSAGTRFADTGLALLLVPVLALSACSGGDAPLGGTGTTDPADTRHSTARPEPKVPNTPDPRPTVRTSTQACGGDPYDADTVLAYRPGNPPYSGEGPHPVVLFKPHLIEDDRQPGVPEPWRATALGTDTQLVVCEYDDDSFVSEDVGSCRYAGGTIGGGPMSDGNATVRSARYTYRVFEARTGDLVDTFTLRGTTSPQESCPETAYHPTVFFQQVRTEALADTLRPLVEKTVR